MESTEGARSATHSLQENSHESGKPIEFLGSGQMYTYRLFENGEGQEQEELENRET